MQDLITNLEEIKQTLGTMREGTIFRFRTVDTFKVVFFVKVDSDNLYCVDAKKLYQTGQKPIKTIKLSRLKSIRVF
jgi:hypothetical protein